MDNLLPLSLIDPSPLSRAWFAQSLAQTGMHIAPYEGVADLNHVRRFEGIFLTCDTGDLVEQVIAAIGLNENPVAVIAYSEKPSARDIFRAISAGAVDYLGGIISEREHLFEAIKLAALHIERERLRRTQKPNVRARTRCLTSRERQVLECLAHGLTNRQIGEQLGISRRTAEVYRSNLQVKLGALNSPDAVRIGIEEGLLIT